jgi:hypothetical protein
MVLDVRLRTSLEFGTGGARTEEALPGFHDKGGATRLGFRVALFYSNSSSPLQ